MTNISDRSEDDCRLLWYDVRSCLSRWLRMKHGSRAGVLKMAFVGEKSRRLRGLWYGCVVLLWVACMMHDLCNKGCIECAE